ncbi:Protein CBG06908 [Caenorhabditis briggsae]|uniref:C2H2-type domain-containing protein n=2 Tax=Caenorhabditis briggsae TaxID=6238 RepID=A0AAE9IR76_CAEBR|nr:Protein CBG06908 [Caenorhabditis briggsae]ULU02227.1 hypothetical protein L3Y34_002055 [Caenorhabditis briggsae]CAP27132.2 Protein CBG06908 [Caenorhabditis briggsae]
MGKTNDSVQKRYRNVRADPAHLSHYLCYFCGKLMSNRMDYQVHMLKVHEVMSQTYQLWSDHTMDTLGLRWSETKGIDDREVPCSLPPSPLSRESKARNSEDDDEDYVYEDEKPAKKRRKDEARRAMAVKQKQAAEDQRRKAEAAAEERQKKAEEKRLEKNRRDAERRKNEATKRAIQQQQQQAAMLAAQEREQKDQTAKRLSLMEMGELEMQGMPIVDDKKKRKRPESTPKRQPRVRQNSEDDQEVIDLVTSIMAESKKKEASSQEVIEEDLTPEIVDRKPFDYSKATTKYCKVCKKGNHYTFPSLFEHYQDHHHAVIKSFDYYGYFNKKLIGKKHLLERDFCQRCMIQFPRVRDYYTHMIQYHIHESVRCQLDFENANNADVEVRMVFRDRILTLGYNFYFQEDQQTASSSDIADFQAATIPAEVNEPSTSASQQAHFYEHNHDEPMEVEQPIQLEQPPSDSGLTEVNPNDVKPEPSFF